MDVSTESSSNIRLIHLHCKSAVPCSHLLQWSELGLLDNLLWLPHQHLLLHPAHDVRDSFFAQTSWASFCQLQTFPSSFLISVSLHRTEELEPCLGFGLRQHCGWFSDLSRPRNFLHNSSKVILLSHHSCVHWSSTFLQESSLCIQNLAVAYKRPSSQPISFPQAFVTKYFHSCLLT